MKKPNFESSQITIGGGGWDRVKGGVWAENLARATRASNRGDLIIEASTLKSQATFLNDAFKIWNEAPTIVKTSESLPIAKKEIRKYVTTLPI